MNVITEVANSIADLNYILDHHSTNVHTVIYLQFSYSNQKLNLANRQNCSLISKTNLVVQGINISNSFNIHLEGISIEGKNRIDVACSQDISIIKANIQGLNCCCPTITQNSIGMRIICSDNVEILECEITGVRDAISLADCSNIRIWSSRINHIGRDGISALRVNTITISNNKIVDFCPNYTGYEASDIKHGKIGSVTVDHADSIQLTNTRNINIFGNTIGISHGKDESDSAWTQSIFIHDDNHSGNYCVSSRCDQYFPVNLKQGSITKVIGNKINNRHLHGITIASHCQDIFHIRGNQLSYAGKAHNPPDISIPAQNFPDPDC